MAASANLGEFYFFHDCALDPWYQFHRLCREALISASRRRAWPPSAISLVLPALNLDHSGGAHAAVFMASAFIGPGSIRSVASPVPWRA
jgi:hypothetical protein